MNSIFRKIGTSNRTQAAIWARHNIAQEETVEDCATRPAMAMDLSAPSPPSLEVPPVATVALEAVNASPEVAHGPACEIKPSVKERPTRSAQVEKDASGAKQENPGKPGVRRCSIDEELDRRAQRRLAEQEERHAELVARTNHLRELRMAREAAERKATECASGKLSVEPALLPLKPSSAGAEDRSSQHPGIRLA